MNFSLDQFTKNLHQEFSDQLTLTEVERLLDIQAKYDSDTPISTGKKLVLTHINFTGVKETEESIEYAGDSINYSEKIDSGVNIWIADNFKGKSSIFKIIKFALTGRNSLKNNIKKWITEILISFKIGAKNFTAYLNTDGRLKTKLFLGKITSLEEIDDVTNAIIFESNSKKDYQKRIQNFFFEQFSYYPLKWTQKASQKDKNELLESSASWKTYFKSMFLESKDSNKLMYGNQGKKIFQMLLGLKLTLPINRLKVKKDNLEFDKAKIATTDQDEAESNRSELEKKLHSVEKELQKLREQENKSTQLNELFKSHNQLTEKIEHISFKNRALSNQEQSLESNLSRLKNEISTLEDEAKSISNEISKAIKKKKDINEYLEVGAFFANIDVKKCPSCDTKVNNFVEQGEEIECSLCNSTVDKSEEDDSREELFQEKIDQLENDISNLKSRKSDLQTEISDTKKKKEEINTELKQILNQKKSLDSTEKYNEKLEEIEEKINNAKKSVDNRSKRDQLTSDKAVIEYRLAEEEIKADNNEQKLEAKISLLSEAIEMLSKKRIENGGKILNRLKELMLNEMKEFGISSITEINITEDFKISYKQDGEYISFDEIAEGEQLRAKIAFYLSLIQLDIEHNFGRHTGFLIIDSPGKEEADANYLEGFSNVLKSIEKRFSDDLQILIGTAERRLEDVVTQQKVTPVNTYIF